MIGRTLSHFRVLAEIGRGGMGVVYRAQDVRLDRQVALKVLPPELVADPDRRRRFLQEARAAASLTDPHIAVVHEVDEAEGTTFIAMELLAGEKLSDRLRRERLPVAVCLDLAVQIARGLAAAHEHGIVHRDLKPANVMVDAHGHAKLIDFGLAKLRDPGPAGADLTTGVADATAPGVVMGTVAYASPEQLRGAPVDTRTDTWSFGVLLYEMIAGRRPFEAASTTEVMSAILRDPPAPLSVGVPPLPEPAAEEVRRILERCLAKDREQRYQSVRDAILDLEAARRKLELREPGTARPAAGRRRLGAAALLTAGGLAVAAVVGWSLISRRPALAFAPRDWLLVADVTNDTGEDVFDVALKVALETDLRQSRYANVVDQAQVQNAARLLRLSPAARLDLDAARKVCQVAGVRALVLPHIVRAGTAYLLEASLVEPATGRVAGQVRVTAKGREDVLLEAIDDLTGKLRRMLGESLPSIAASDPPLVQYTTSSLEALKLLQLGRDAWGAAEFAKAERCFREALELDPRFSAARGSLGLVLIQFLGRPEEGKKELTQAVADASDVSPRESVMVKALHKQFVEGDLPGALDEYRFISELYPDMMQPYNNSGRIYEKMGRFAEAAEMYERASRADPKNPVPFWNLWWLSVRSLRDPAVAERAARSLAALLPAEANAASAVAWSLVMQKRFREAEEAMRGALKLDPASPYAMPNLGHLLLRRGAAPEASAVYQRVLDKVRAGEMQTGFEHAALSLGLGLAAEGRTGDAKRVLLEAVAESRARGRRTARTPEDRALIAAMLAAAGRVDEGRALADRLASDAALTPDARYNLAEAYAQAGERARALGQFEAAVAAGHGDAHFVLVDPALATIRDDPAVERILRPATWTPAPAR